jgi:hypothetical protein
VTRLLSFLPPAGCLAALAECASGASRRANPAPLCRPHVGYGGRSDRPYLVRPRVGSLSPGLGCAPRSAGPASRRSIESRRWLSMRSQARPAPFGRLTSPQAPFYPRPELSHIKNGSAAASPGGASHLERTRGHGRSAGVVARREASKWKVTHKLIGKQEKPRN